MWSEISLRESASMHESNRVGQQIGDYHLLYLLGRGRFAEIYLGEHVHLHTHAAIKLLDGYWSQKDQALFLAQAAALAHLNHPHIIKVLAFGVADRSPFLVMSYAPHGTLRERHPRGTRLPLDTLAHYVAQLADALQHVHQHKLIHRDIKPHNMLLGENHEVLLSDFGIAVISYSLDPMYTGLSDFEGTVLYAAPEQLKGKPRRSSDQYALGVVIYEWLCGSWPFSGSFDEVVHQHLFVSPPAMREKGVEVSPTLEQVVMKALAKTPEERFSNVQVFASAFLRACRKEQLSLEAALSQEQDDLNRQFKSPLPFPRRVL